MKKYTPTIILGFICLGFTYLALIFGVDTVLSLGSHATISEYLHNWIQDPNNLDILSAVAVLIVGGIGYFMYHIINFKSK
jgi:TRAP-type C4-dicarboxylate transport system permease small subunit